MWPMDLLFSIGLSAVLPEYKRVTLDFPEQVKEST